MAALIQTPSNLFGNDAAAAYLGVTPRTLEVWRCTKRHQIPYIKVGRLVKYRQAASRHLAGGANRRRCGIRGRS